MGRRSSLERHATTAGDLLLIHRELLRLLSECGIKMDDWRYTELWRRYCVAVESGEKVSALVAEVVERNGVTETQVWRVIRRLRRIVDPIGIEKKHSRRKRIIQEWL